MNQAIRRDWGRVKWLYRGYVLLAAAVALAMVLGACGCAWGGGVDRAQFDVHQQAYDLIGAVCGHAEQFVAAADVYAGKKHGLQALAIEKAKAEWYAQYTDADGVVSVPAEDLKANLARMKAADDELAESRRQWAHAAQQFRDTLALTRRSLETLKDKDASLQAKKSDLAAAINAALATVVGAIGGAAL